MHKILLLVLFFPLVAFGEDADSISGKQIELNEVTVVDFKQNHSDKQTPISMSVLNENLVKDHEIISLKDFSSYIPNFYMPDYGSKQTSPIYIRGIGSKINAPSVGLYVDGIPHFENSAFDIDLSNISQIEILRGPQGTLYGRNTIGGIINIYTKSPLTYQGTTFKVGAGNYGEKDVSLSNYTRLNEDMGFSISGKYRHNDGYFTNLYTQEKDDKMDVASGHAAFEWNITPAWKMKVSSTLDYSDQGGYPYGLYNAVKGTVGAVDYNENNLYRRLLSTSGLSLKYKSAFFEFNSQSSFQFLTDKQGIDQDFTEEKKYYVVQKVNQRMYSQEFNFKSVCKGSYQWLMGAFAFWQGIDKTVAMDYFKSGYSTYKTYDTPTYGIAFYHQSSFEDFLIENLSVNLGVRYDFEKASSDYFAYKDVNEARTQTDGFKDDLHFSQITPKVTFQYALPTQQTLYASATRGYKTGGFNTSFDTEEDRSFKPEYSWNYEVGSKASFWGNRIQAEVCLFYIDWKDQQIYQALASKTGSMLKNAGHSDSKGVEASVHATPFKNFSMQVNYGYTYATFKEYRKSATVSYAGNHLPLVPAQTLSISADYTFIKPVSCIDQLTLSANYVGTGTTYWTETNAVSQGYYGLLNAKVSATKGIFTWEVWGKNLTDKDYLVYYFEATSNWGQKGKPLTFGTSLSITL